MQRRNFMKMATMFGTGVAGQRGEQTTYRSIRDADHLVKDEIGLRSAFESASHGDVIMIAAENAPYEIHDWLDIDVSGVRVISDVAVRDPPLLRAAPGANCGGVRVGHNNSVHDVTIEGVSFDGNYKAQTAGIQHHAFVIDDAENVTVKNCYATSTHPHHEHGSGGSGVTVTKKAEDVYIDGFRAHDIGDRAVQIGGERVLTERVVTTNGFDRSVALDYSPADGSPPHAGTNITVNGVRAHTNIAGSIIGTGQEHKHDGGIVHITDVRAMGFHRSLVTVFGGNYNRFLISNCYGLGGNVDGISLGRNRSTSTAPSTVTNCHLHHYGRQGITVAGGRETGPFVITGNIIDNCSREDPGGYNGIHLENGRGTCGLNAIAGDYRQYIGGSNTDQYEIGLNSNG